MVTEDNVQDLDNGKVLLIRQILQGASESGAVKCPEEIEAYSMFLSNAQVVRAEPRCHGDGELEAFPRELFA